MSDRIYFRSSEPAPVLAAWLATLVYEDREVPANVPWLCDSGEWWELSRANDHKMDLLGPGRFAYRDRYGWLERMVRIRAALLARSGVTLEDGA